MNIRHTFSHLQTLHSCLLKEPLPSESAQRLLCRFVRLAAHLANYLIPLQLGVLGHSLHGPRSVDPRCDENAWLVLASNLYNVRAGAGHRKVRSGWRHAPAQKT